MKRDLVAFFGLKLCGVDAHYGLGYQHIGHDVAAKQLTPLNRELHLMN
jgi:hypothetical protein